MKNNAYFDEMYRIGHEWSLAHRAHEELKEQIIKEKGWEDKIAVKGSFCMKACQNHIGLGIRINGRQIEGVTAQNAREILDRELSAALA